MKATILVTGAGALLGQGVIKSLRLAGRGYRIVAADPDPRAVALYWADAAYLVPMASAPEYVEVVSRVLERERPAAVLIGTDRELLPLAYNRKHLEAAYHTRIVVSSPDLVRMADDKWLTYQFLKSNGLPHPRSALPQGVDDLRRECGFPLVVKPRRGARSEGVYFVDDEEDLRYALRKTRDAIVQECIGTAEDEYTSGLLASGDHVHSVVTMRRDLRDGNTFRAYVVPDSPFDSFLAEVARKMRGFGPLNFQFRATNGVPKIFEINARFSGTTPLRAYAGFNEVDYFLRHLLRGDRIPKPALRNFVILRYWDELVLDPERLGAMSAAAPLADDLPRRPQATARQGMLAEEP